MTREIDTGSFSVGDPLHRPFDQHAAACRTQPGCYISHPRKTVVVELIIYSNARHDWPGHQSWTMMSKQKSLVAQ